MATSANPQIYAQNPNLGQRINQEVIAGSAVRPVITDQAGPAQINYVMQPPLQPNSIQMTKYTPGKQPGASYYNEVPNRRLLTTEVSAVQDPLWKAGVSGPPIEVYTAPGPPVPPLQASQVHYGGSRLG